MVTARFILLWTFVSLSLVQGACTIHEVIYDPTPSVEMPGRFTADGGDVSPAERWWEAFDSPVLNRLVSQALDGGLDMRRAWARVKQGRALATLAGVGQFPQIDAGVSVGGQGTPLVEDPDPISTPVGDVEIPSQPNNQATYGLTVDISYEIDVWGKVRSSVAAGKEGYFASIDDAQSVAMSIAAMVTETWLALVEQRQKRQLVAAQMKVNETLLELVQLRFQQGLVGALDVYQQRQQLASVQGGLPLIDGQISVLQHQLAALLGQSATAFVLPEEEMALPTLPPLPEVGVPMDLLQHRPDVRSAYRRLIASDHRLGVSIADQFPSFRLGATTGFSAIDMADFFTGFLWKLVGSLFAPLFDGGRRSAEVERHRGIVEDLAAAYAQTVLTAIREVDDALVKERQQGLYLSEITRQVTLAEATLREARERYLNGMSSFLPVLSASVALQQLQQGSLASQRQQLSYRVQLCRALGGSWTQNIETPDGVPSEHLSVPLVEPAVDADPTQESSTMRGEQ